MERYVASMNQDIINTKKDYYFKTIKEIDGFPVSAYIRPDLRMFVSTYGRYFRCIASYKFENVPELTDNIKNFMETLKYDKKYDSFILLDKHMEETVVFEDKYLGVQDCCVCLEATSRKTCCRHALCFRCAFKTQTNTCPMCRGCLSDDEEDDGESDFEDM